MALASARQTAGTGSPAPPRTAAYDSPAMRCSGQSSLSGSSTSLASAGRLAELLDPTELPPQWPTQSMDLDQELQAEARAQRRRRSPDERAEEEAKRLCYDASRRGADSPTFADAVRKPHSPTLTTNTKPPGANKSAHSPNHTNTDAAPNTAEFTKKKRPRYPPLVVERLPNWATHFKALASRLGRPPNARPFGTGVRFSPESEEEYRSVQTYLVSLEKYEGISWFAYSLPAEKKLKVAIRGLPPDTSPQDIEEELREMGFEPEYVRHINARQGRPGCVFYALINKTQDVRRIYDTSVFMNMRGVKIEAWRGKRGPAQCHRCQKFRHSSHQCHRPIACVKCGEGHAARDCQRPREEPATCANCGGPHPACSIKCPVFQKELTHKRTRTVAITFEPTHTNKNPKFVGKPAKQLEAHGTTLMATSNEPTSRGEAIPVRRHKKKRGGKGRRPNPPTESDATPQTANTEVTPGPPRVQAPRGTGVGVNAGPTQQKRRSEKEAETKPGSAKTQPGTMKGTTSDFTACAIRLLMDLIKAIRQGQDAEQIILDGLAALLTLYHV